MAEEVKRVSFSDVKPAQKKQSMITFSRRYSMQNAKKTMSDAAVRLARIISRTQSGMPVSQQQHLCSLCHHPRACLFRKRVWDELCMLLLQ
jgi:hypothetical protein